MPLIGWYLNIATYNVFVWRLFKIYGPDITQNINKFHQAFYNRIVFLNKEGIGVDFENINKDYIKGFHKLFLV